MIDPRYSVVGLLIGFLVGLTGMGGGSLMTPLLILLVGVKPTIAVGSDLVYAAITKIIGGFLHHKQSSVNYKLAYRFALGSVPASLLGVWSVHRLEKFLGDEVQHLVLRFLGVMLILVSVALIIKSHSKAQEWQFKIDLEKGNRHLIWAISSGAVLGFLVGLTSVGSGSLFGVLMLVVFGMRSKEMVGTDVYHAAMLSTAAAMGHIWAGNVNYGLVGSLLIGSIPGVLLGGRLTAKLPEHILRPVLASVLFLSGLKMI